ncbi:MAG: bifunctional 5,10-methylenetetrahydrofolate dehydrogenase/5,10-methenyltetrahydrofolate cyclohydrolase [Parvibaculales bacterium]
MGSSIDGAKIASALRARIAQGVKNLQAKHNLTPGLAVVLVGDDAASQIYVKNKAIATKAAGMNSYEFRLPADTSQDVLLEKVHALNNERDINGILVQFPVPPQISQAAVIEAIAPAKDVDGLNPINAGRLVSGLPALAPCTPQGVVALAKAAFAKTNLEGQHVVIIGRSNLVGKPVAQLFLKENCTVTLAHSRTRDLPALCRQADILVAAVGIAEFVKGDWIKKGACVIDVGINRIDAPEKGEGKTRLVGDVDFAAAIKVAGAVTPVPGGVGPLTIACLLANTLIATCRQNNIAETE